MASLHVGIRPASLVDPRGPRFGAAVTRPFRPFGRIDGEELLDVNGIG